MDAAPPPITVPALAHLLESLAPEASSLEQGWSHARHLASVLGVFFGHAQVRVWSNGAHYLPVLEIHTDQGLRYALADAQVLGPADLPGKLRQALGANFQDVGVARTFSQLRALLPEDAFPRQWHPDPFSSLGVGLHLEAAVPRAQLDPAALIQAMADFSCHPFFGQRIVDDLIQHGARTTTVMSIFARQLPAVTQALAGLGVSVHRTWPKPGAGNSELPAGVDPTYGAFAPRRTGP